ncbi:MAG: LuxR C-terminal-related transcriptional regulator [Gaiellaceae bacterium]
MGRLTDKAVVVYDHHPLWLEALHQLLTRVGIRVAGSTTSSDEALALVEEQQPDMLVVGLEALNGELDGLGCVERAKQVHPELKVVALAPHNDPLLVEAAFAAGVTVYCAKTAEPDDLASAIRQAFEHSVYFAAPRTQTIATAAMGTASVGPGLTRRELEILRLVAEGYSNSQLARMLWVTEQTVKFHLSNIYRKLNVANRTEASRWAQLHGLLPVPREVAAAVA